MTTPIKFIFFDVGGVIVLDFHGTNKWQQLLDDLKIPVSIQDSFNDLFDQYELLFNVGKASVTDFTKAAQDKFNLSFPPNYSFLDDIINRFAPNTSLWPILAKLQSKYPLGLLTNMYPDMLDSLKSKYFPPDINWSVEIDSSLVAVAKPNPAIYKLAQAKANTKPENILFIDNLQRNLDVATSLGWQTLLYDALDLTLSNQKIVNFLL